MRSREDLSFEYEVITVPRIPSCPDQLLHSKLDDARTLRRSVWFTQKSRFTDYSHIRDIFTETSRIIMDQNI